MKNIIPLLLLLTFFGCSKSQPPAQQTAGAGSPTAGSQPAATASVPDPATAGNIKGVVNFKGAAPKIAALDMTADPMCPQKPQPSDAVAVKNGKLANVFVYVKEGVPAGMYPIPSDPVVLDQQNCRYTPHVMGVMAKQPFKITNTDQADHNVHDMPSNNPAWNESQMPTDQPIMKTFPNPEMMIPLQCNQHPWMRAYVNVMSHPYYAVSGEDGTFEIKNLPPGEYTLAAVHERFGEKTMQIKIAPKQTAKADFEYTATK